MTLAVRHGVGGSCLLKRSSDVRCGICVTAHPVACSVLCVRVRSHDYVTDTVGHDLQPWC